MYDNKIILVRKTYEQYGGWNFEESSQFFVIFYIQREREKRNRGKGASENDNFGIPTKLYIMTALKFGFEINIFYMILVFVIYLLKSIKYKLVLMLARINCYHCITRLTLAKARP